MEQQQSSIFLPRFGRDILKGRFKSSGGWRALALVLVFALAVPLAAACGKTIGETIDDTTITTRVKTAMLNDPAVGGLRIDVDTFKGVVTLSGRVKNPSERDQAIAIARRVNGVAEVKDALQIVPEGEPKPAAAPL